MKGLIRLATILGIICGAAFGAVRFLKLPHEYLYYVIALSAVVLAIGALISGIRWMMQRKAKLDGSGPKVSQEAPSISAVFSGDWAMAAKPSSGREVSRSCRPACSASRCWSRSASARHSASLIVRWD